MDQSEYYCYLRVTKSFTRATPHSFTNEWMWLSIRPGTHQTLLLRVRVCDPSPIDGPGVQKKTSNANTLVGSIFLGILACPWETAGALRLQGEDTRKVTSMVLG